MALETTFAKAVECHRHGQLDEAEKIYRAITSADPCHFDASYLLGVILLRQGHFESAERELARAIHINPRVAGAHYNRGVALKDLGHFEKALACFDNAISLNPDYAIAWCNRGAVLHKLGRYNEALASYNEAIALNPDFAEAFYNRGLALLDNKRLTEGLASLDKAIALKPDYAAAFNDRGLALRELKRSDEALDSFNRAIALQPDFAEALCNRGLLFEDIQRLDEALASYDDAIAARTDYAEAFGNRAVMRLLFGRFAEGWEDSEYRWQTPKFRDRCRQDVDPQMLALWSSRESLRGKRVLVVAEQGVGEEIMFSSMVPDLVEDARGVALECDPRLSGLFARSFPQVQITPRKAPPAWRGGDFDSLLPAGSLGRLYRNAADDFPAREAYLQPAQEIVSKWRTRLSNLGNTIKIGVSWRGGTDWTRKEARSIPLELWRPIFDVEGVSFISLQYGDAKPEIEAIRDAIPRPITHFEPAEIDDFDELMGLVKAVDLVISVQTALVHLSGAGGQACWVMVPCAAEWRYGMKGKSMPWYSSVKLYRQQKRGEWDETIARVAADLDALIKSKRKHHLT